MRWFAMNSSSTLGSHVRQGPRGMHAQIKQIRKMNPVSEPVITRSR